MPDEEKNMMRVIVCKPDEYAEVVEIEDSLESMQNMVGGLIEEYMPWDDEVAIICNEEGKMNGLPFNRAIRDENGGMPMKEKSHIGDTFLRSVILIKKQGSSISSEMVAMTAA